MSELPGSVDGKRFLRAMARFGWRVESQRGSHRKLVHPERTEFLVVSFHREIHRPAMRATLRRAGISVEAFADEL